MSLLPYFFVFHFTRGNIYVPTDLVQLFLFHFSEASRILPRFYLKTITMSLNHSNLEKGEKSLFIYFTIQRDQELNRRTIQEEYASWFMISSSQLRDVALNFMWAFMGVQITVMGVNKGVKKGFVVEPASTYRKWKILPSKMLR